MTWNDNITIEGLDNSTKIPSEGGTFSFLIYNDSDEDTVVYISSTGALQVFVNSSYSVPKNSFTAAHYTIQVNENNQVRNFSFSFRLSMNGAVEDTINFIQLGHFENNNLGNFENIKYYPGISTYAPTGNIGTTGTMAADFNTSDISEENTFKKFNTSVNNINNNITKILAQYTIYELNTSGNALFGSNTSFVSKSEILKNHTYMFVDKTTNESIIIKFTS